MTIYEAIIEALNGYNKGETFSLIGLTEKVEIIRGKIVTDGCVSRRLMEMNKGKKDILLNHILRYDVARDGVYRIKENREIKREIKEVVYQYPSERLFI